MEKFLQIAVYLVISGLLVAAAVNDVRSRQIPVAIGHGLLLAADILLLVQGRYFEAAFLVIAVIGSRGGYWNLLIYICAILMVSVVGEKTTYPFIAGILLFYLMFRMKWLGGGDAQVAYALIAVGRDWTMIAYLLGVALVVGLILVFRRHGFSGAFVRLWRVTRSLTKSSENDQEAIRTPWVLWAMVGGVLHLFVFPGALSQLIMGVW